MHRWLLVLVVIFAGQIICFAPVPASAQADDGEDYSVSCAHNAATWKGSDAEGSSVVVPKGTFTRIFTCPLAGHLVRINFASMWQTQYRCGLLEDGTISVWVDSVKVVDKREIGDYSECMNRREAKVVVHEIIVDQRWQMTICSNRGNNDEAKNCDVIDLSEKVSRATTKPSDAVIRTPVTLIMVKADADACRVLDEKLQGHMLDDPDPVTASFGLYSNVDDLTNSKSKTYLLDVDNDGLLDKVTLEPSGDKEIDMDRVHWRRGESSLDLAIDGKAVNGLEWNNILVDFITFIRFGGKTYIYKRDNSVGNALPNQTPDWWEAFAGTLAQITPTRHLLAANKDGTFEDICSWAPKPRPEEFM